MYIHIRTLRQIAAVDGPGAGEPLGCTSGGGDGPHPLAAVRRLLQPQHRGTCITILQ